MKTKIMVTGTDWMCCGTGFSEELRHVLYRLAQTGLYEIYWVGINYVGMDLDIPDTTFPDIPQKGTKIKNLSGAGGPTQLYGFEGFKRAFNKYSPDLVMTMGDPKQFEPYIYERKKPDGVKFPYLVYTTLDGIPIYPEWREKIFPYTNVNLAMTDWAMREYQKAGINMGGYIHHGINWTFFATNLAYKYTTRRNMGITDDTTLFISWDVNQHRKRIDALLKCWKAFRPQSKKAKLFLYMDSDCHIGWNIESLIKQYDISRESILLPEDILGRRKYWEQAEPVDVHKSIAQIGDVYLSCTSGEGFGKTSLEALSLGMPVIITDYAASTEVCKEGSILVPTYPGESGRYRYNDATRHLEGGIVNQEKFVEAMTRLYDNPAERIELGARGREWAQNFDYDTQTLPAWLDILGRINPDVILAEEVLRV
jgi:glycosyltransferase involved in cell wall biosynthesis